MMMFRFGKRSKCFTLGRSLVASLTYYAFSFVSLPVCTATIVYHAVFALDRTIAISVIFGCRRMIIPTTVKIVVFVGSVAAKTSSTAMTVECA